MDWNRSYALAVGLAAAMLLFVLARTRRGEKLVAEVVGAVVKTVDKAKELIAGEEGLRLTVYRDPGAGAWTIGWGHLVQTGEGIYPYGTIRTITRAKADEFFEQDLKEARDAVARLVTVPINENQRAALESFVFNVGAGAFASSTLLKKLNRSDYTGAAAEFDRWVYDDGKRIDGLVARRDREQEIFLA